MRLAASAVYEDECGPKIKRDSKPVALGGNCRRARPTRNALLRHHHPCESVSHSLVTLSSSTTASLLASKSPPMSLHVHYEPRAYGQPRVPLGLLWVACRLWSVLAGPHVGSLLVMCGKSKRIFLNAPRPVWCIVLLLVVRGTLRPAPRAVLFIPWNHARG